MIILTAWDSLTDTVAGLDLRTRRARIAGETVDLTTREFNLLELFLRRRLRPSPARKFGAHLISTVRGVGYAIDR